MSILPFHHDTELDHRQELKKWKPFLNHSCSCAIGSMLETERKKKCIFNTIVYADDAKFVLIHLYTRKYFS